ncbi:hypothetical protein FF1_023791 [Malus domestica]
MDLCPFMRVIVGNLALKIPVASKPARFVVYPSSSPCFCKIQLTSSTSPLKMLSSPTAATSMVTPFVASPGWTTSATLIMAPGSFSGRATTLGSPGVISRPGTCRPCFCFLLFVEALLLVLLLLVSIDSDLKAVSEFYRMSTRFAFLPLENFRRDFSKLQRANGEEEGTDEVNPQPSSPPCVSKSLDHGASLTPRSSKASSEKQQNFIQDSLVNLPRSRGIDLVRINTERSLADQGPFDCVLHKLYGDDWNQHIHGPTLTLTLDGGPDPQYPTNKVMIWDGHQGRCIGGLSFCSVVRSVRLRRNRIVVVLEQQKTHTESDIHSVTNDNLIINVFNSLSTTSCTEAMQSMLHSKNITVSECFDDELVKKKKLRVFRSDPFDYHNIPSSDHPTYDEFMAEAEVRAAHNVLEACAQTDTIHKVVFTSSVTAVIWRDFGGTTVLHRRRRLPRPEALTRETGTMSIFVALSKTLAERTAWALAMDGGLNMVSINRGLLLGPDLTITDLFLKGTAGLMVRDKCLWRGLGTHLRGQQKRNELRGAALARGQLLLLVALKAAF